MISKANRRTIVCEKAVMHRVFEGMYVQNMNDCEQARRRASLTSDVDTNIRFPC
jgi:hypothetical protein